MRWKTTVVKKASKVSFEKSFDSGSRSDHDDKPVVGVIAAYTRLVHGLKLAASASRDSVDIVIRRTQAKCHAPPSQISISPSAST